MKEFLVKLNVYIIYRFTFLWIFISIEKTQFLKLKLYGDVESLSFWKWFQLKYNVFDFFFFGSYENSREFNDPKPSSVERYVCFTGTWNHSNKGLTYKYILMQTINIKEWFSFLKFYAFRNTIAYWTLNKNNLKHVLLAINITLSMTAGERGHDHVLVDGKGGHPVIPKTAVQSLLIQFEVTVTFM